MASSGFNPKKVTLNKYGGGGFDFGSSYGGPTPKPAQSHGYRPVSAPMVAAPPPAVASAHVPMSPPSRGTIEYQTQFSAPQKPMSTQQSRGKLTFKLYFDSDTDILNLQILVVI